jgi:hypothetical protein
VSGPKLRASVGAAVLPAQPLPVQQVGAGQFRAQQGAAEPADRLAVQVLGDVAPAQQGAGARLDAQAEVAPPAWVNSASRVSAPAACGAFPLRAAASISSGSAHMEM